MFFLFRGKIPIFVAGVKVKKKKSDTRYFSNFYKRYIYIMKGEGDWSVNSRDNKSEEARKFSV